MSCSIAKSTPAKYEKMMEALVPPLFDLLKELDALEQEIFARNRAMDAEKPALNIPSYQTHPKWIKESVKNSSRADMQIASASRVGIFI